MRTQTYSRVVLLLATLIFPVISQADDIKIENAWVRSTAPGQKVAGAFMDITAHKDMELISGATPVAELVELHYMRMDGGMMEMRELESIKLPKDKTVSLKPGGLHAMLIGLKKQIKPGDRVPVTLTFKDGDGKEESMSITVEAFSHRN